MEQNEEDLSNKELIKERLKEEDKTFKERCKGCSFYKGNFCIDHNNENSNCNFLKEE